LITSRGNDWTTRFPLIVEAVNHLKVRSCLIDGEAVCCDERGLAILFKAATAPGRGQGVSSTPSTCSSSTAQICAGSRSRCVKATLASILREAHADRHGLQDQETDKMTTLTMRMINKGDFVVTGPDVEPMKFKSRREARDWCMTHHPGSPITEVGPGGKRAAKAKKKSADRR
jgi:hypothetical protein